MFFSKKSKEPGALPAPKETPTEVLPPLEPVETVTESDPKGEALAPTATAASEIVYPEGLRLFFLISSVFVSLFLISLDRLIVATAIPAITNEFNSVKDIGWYGSAYLLTNAAFQLMFGKVYTFFSVKATFMISIFLFEAGSAICGAAPNSTSFIVARAIQGLGAAGIMAGSVCLLSSHVFWPAN